MSVESTISPGRTAAPPEGSSGSRVLLLAAFLASAFAMGCGSPLRAYAINPDYSINVGRFDPAWTKDPSRQTKAQEDVLRTRGRPDFVHVKWSDVEDIVDKSTMWRIERAQGKRAGEGRESWIYLDRGEEVEFPSPAESRVKPLSDKLRQICKMGDPQRIEVLPESRRPGGRVEKWTYYNMGYIFTFRDGVLTDTVSIPPLPHYRNF